MPFDVISSKRRPRSSAAISRPATRDLVDDAAHAAPGDLATLVERRLGRPLPVERADERALDVAEEQDVDRAREVVFPVLARAAQVEDDGIRFAQDGFGSHGADPDRRGAALERRFHRVEAGSIPAGRERGFSAVASPAGPRRGARSDLQRSLRTPGRTRRRPSARAR
jgi:hypothetical protein